MMNSALNTTNSKWRISISSALVLFCSLYTIIPDCFSVGISGVSWLYIILGFVYFAVARKTSMRIPLYFGGTILYAFTIIVIQVIHGDYKAAFWSGVALLLIPCIFASKVDRKDLFLKIVDCVIWSGLIVCFLGIVEALTGFNLFYTVLNTIGAVPNYNAERLGITRIIGFTSHAISYAAYLMFLLSLVMYRMVQLNQRKKRVYIFIYVLAVVNAILTLSRSAIMAIILCQFLLLLKFGVRKTVRKIVLVVCIMLVLSLIIQIIAPGFDLISQIFLMMIGIFNKDIGNKIAESVGVNAGGVGERLLLYKWVWDSMKNNMLIGYGGEAAFNFNYTISGDVWNIVHTKESIEVQYLHQLYHYGIIGMVSQIIMYISFLRAGVKSLKKSKASWEGKLTFDYVFLITLIVCFLLFFAVNQATERYMFNMFLYLFFAYSTNRLYEEK